MQSLTLNFLCFPQDFSFLHSWDYSLYHHNQLLSFLVLIFNNVFSCPVLILILSFYDAFIFLLMQRQLEIYFHFIFHLQVSHLSSSPLLPPSQHTPTHASYKVFNMWNTFSNYKKRFLHLLITYLVLVLILHVCITNFITADRTKHS